MVKSFRQAFVERRDQTGRSVAEIARGAGVSVEQLKKMNQRDTSSTNVDDAVKIAHYFGVSLDEFLGDATIADRPEMLETYSRLSLEDRKFMLEVAKARAAQGRMASGH